MAAGVWADDVRSRSISANMIPAALRVIFNGKDARLRPETAVADGLDDAAKREVVIGNLCFRFGHAGLGAAGMVVGQADDNEIRQLAALTLDPSPIGWARGRGL